MLRRRLSTAGQVVRSGWPRWVRPTLREVARRPPIREVLPGVHHWTRVHPRIRIVVSSYYVEPAGVLIDPLVPREGLDWFRARRQPGQVVMTIRHHLRDSERFVAEFGCALRCHEDGLHEFGGGPSVDGFTFGEQLAPGVTAHEVDAISPDDAALHVEAGHGALAFGDGLTRETGELTFVPDFLIGDDPPAVKRGLTASLERLLDLEFDTLLFAHGDPLVGGGKLALREFVERQDGR